MSQDSRPTSLSQFPVTNIEYLESFTAFLDVLGFKTLVSQTDSNKVSLYYSIIKKALSFVGQTFAHGKHINFQVMSDSIVISTFPRNSTELEKLKACRALCSIISFLQFELAISGIWIRGGIAQGKIGFHDNAFVVGPALVEAVELEKIARYPRVALHPSIADKLNLSRRNLVAKLNKLENSDHSTEWIYDFSKPERQNGKPGMDDLLFVNFTQVLRIEPNIAYESCQEIRKHLARGLYGPAVHLEKYLWIKDFLVNSGLDEKCQGCFADL